MGTNFNFIFSVFVLSCSVCDLVIFLLTIKAIIINLHELNALQLELEKKF